MDGLMLLRQASEAGLTVQAEGGNLKVRGPRSAESIVRLLAEYKPEVLAFIRGERTEVTARKSEAPPRLAAPADAAALRERYEERAVIDQFDGHRHRVRAEARAWNVVACLWHRWHGLRSCADLCAGCGKPIGDESDLLLLPHGERAHAGNGGRCVIAYGRRWKRAAATALLAIGIPTPPVIAAEIGVSIKAETRS